MKIEKIECFTIWSEDPFKLADWYKKVFDLKESLTMNEPDDTGIGFDIGGMLLWLGYHSEVKGKSKDPFRFIIEFMVDDLDETYKRLKNVDALIIREPSFSPTVSLWIITAHDPDGNTIQFMNKEYKPL